MVAAKVKRVSEPSNGGQHVIDSQMPYVVRMVLAGQCDLLFHRWSCEGVEAKAAAKKGSAAKKTDDVQSYVYRNDDDEICIPGEYLRGALVASAKSSQDPRSPRKSATDLIKAGVICLTHLASLGTTEWDYLDTRRVKIQMAAINRVRPAMKAGWKAEFLVQVQTPEYVPEVFLRELVDRAGRLIGLADFRPTYGRFAVVEWERMV